MMILAIIGLVVMGFILGFVSRSPISCCPHWDYDMKCGKLSSLETRLLMLENENDRLKHIVNIFEIKKRYFEEYYAAHCYSCQKTFYSKDFKDKDVAKMLTDISLTSEEIAKKLGFDIK